MRGRDADGRLVCHKGCASARLAREGWALATQELQVPSARGPLSPQVDTIVARNGGPPLCVHVLREESALRPRPEPAGAVRLTARQRDVLRLLDEGHIAKEIASCLVLSEETVRNHIRAILRALDAHSQLEALSKARRLGLV